MTTPHTDPASRARTAADRAEAAGKTYRRGLVIIAALAGLAVLTTLIVVIVVAFRLSGIAGTNASTLNLLLGQQAASGDALKQFTDREDKVADRNTIARRRDLRALCAYLHGGPCVGLHFPKAPPPPPPIVITPAPTTRPGPTPTPHPHPQAHGPGPAATHRPAPSPTPHPTAHSPPPRPRPTHTASPTPSPEPSPPLLCLTINGRKICTPPGLGLDHPMAAAADYAAVIDYLLETPS